MCDDSDFPSGSKEEQGLFIRIPESVSHPMTFKILWDLSNKVLH